jgi:hypothetical protein
MTISAYKIAFGYFRQQRRDRSPTIGTPIGYIKALRFSIPMVEVHHIGRIVQTTIHARLRFCRDQKISTACLVDERPIDKFLSILPIVLLFVRFVTRATISLRSPFRSEIEFFKGFVTFTSSTPSQRHLIFIVHNPSRLAKLAAGIEPATSALQKRCSAWLSYASEPRRAERVSIGRRHKACKPSFPLQYAPPSSPSRR